jgi:hypothetical protein
MTTQPIGPQLPLPQILRPAPQLLLPLPRPFSLLLRKWDKLHEGRPSGHMPLVPSPLVVSESSRLANERSTQCAPSPLSAAQQPPVAAATVPSASTAAVTQATGLFPPSSTIASESCRLADGAAVSVATTSCTLSSRLT